MAYYRRRPLINTLLERVHYRWFCHFHMSGFDDGMSALGLELHRELLQISFEELRYEIHVPVYSSIALSYLFEILVRCLNARAVIDQDYPNHALSRKRRRLKHDKSNNS
jgi:hypothetical protein